MAELNELRKRVLKCAYKNGLSTDGKDLCDNMHLKRSTVDYALEKLFEEKYCSRLRYEINLDSLGVGKFAWFFVAINWSDFDEDKFISKALELAQVHTVAKVTGTYDFAIKIFGPSIQSISAFIIGLEQLFEGSITDTHVIFANKNYKRHYLKVRKSVPVKLKKIDRLLLEEKTKDPYKNLVDISAKYKVHRNTISNRWKHLVKSRVILKEVVDPTQKGFDEIGLGLKAFVIIKPQPGYEEKVMSEMLEMEDMEDLFTTLSNEIIAIIRTENSQTLAYFHKTLAKACRYIKRTDTIIFLTKYSRDGMSRAELENMLAL
ncbi:MAG: hypothetical protein AABW59_02800 [archaeon]